MDPREALALRDIHLPEPVGWWPPAPGWWGILFVLALLIAGWVWLRVRRARKAVKRAALRELTVLRADCALQRTEKLRRLSVLMRRTALSVFPRRQVAGLTGIAWLRFLDGPAAHKPFSQGVGRLLTEGPYRLQADEELDALFGACEVWIKALPEAKR